MARRLRARSFARLDRLALPGFLTHTETRTMATASRPSTRGKHKQAKASTGQGWRSTDDEEIERRRQRAHSEQARVRSEDGRGVYGTYTVTSSDSDRHHRVELRSLDRPFNSCDCPDYQVNGLGTCKHVEAVRQHLARRRVPAQRQLTEIFADRSDQYGDGPKARIVWADRLRANGPVRRALQPFFGSDDTLAGEPTEAIPALQRALRAANLGRDRVRLSEALAPWLERLARQRRQQTDREHFLADVAAGLAYWRWAIGDWRPACCPRASLPLPGHQSKPSTKIGSTSSRHHTSKSRKASGRLLAGGLPAWSSLLTP